MIHTIYLDLDDVCNTLTPNLLNYIGCPVVSNDYSLLRNQDVVAAANRFLGRGRYNQSTFWQSIPRTVWATVPKTPELPWLLRTCQGLVGKNIYIATSPTKDPDCLAGKLEWIHDNLPRWLHREYFITPRKWRLGCPGALLIDDNKQNCHLFEKHGGRTILFPRPWNSAAGQPVQQYLLDQLERLCRK